MLKKTIYRCGPVAAILMDSITKVDAMDSGMAVISASHGGSSSGEFALEYPLGVAMFNDAGTGKDRAGILALEMLQDAGIPACAVAHTSARIGDSQDHWDAGVISVVNEAARSEGFAVGEMVRVAVTAWVDRRGSAD